MEFDTHLALVQGCLTHAKRVSGPLDNLRFDKDHDAMQEVIRKVEECISRYSEKEVYQTYMFLLLNCDSAVQNDDLQDSELSHLVGIAPIISLDLFLALSVEVFGKHNFIFDAISVLPVSLSLDLSSTFVSLYCNNNIIIIADKLGLLCLALYHNVLTSKCEKDFQMFLRLLERVLHSMHAEEKKADSSTYFYTLKAALTLLKYCLNHEIPYDVEMWKDFYTRPSLSDNCVHDNLNKARNIIISSVSEICTNIPERSMFNTCDESCPVIKSVREQAYECLAGLRNLSPTRNYLLNALEDIARKPECVSDKIKESSLSSLCSNARIKNDDQVLWLKALIRHEQGLVNEEALRTLHELVDLFDSEDENFVCNVFHHFPEVRTDSFRDLVLVCFSKLNRESKLDVLDYKIRCCGTEDLFSDGNCEAHVLEVLNRLVAQGEADSEEDQLIVLTYKSPQLVVKHTLLTAASNKLFSESVVDKILKVLQAVFACPAKTSFHGTTLTDVVLLDSIFSSDEIKNDLQGLQNLVRLLLKADFINAEHFLLSCIFPSLLNAAKDRQEQTVILLLQVLLDFQSEVPLCKTSVKIATVLVYLGQLLEWFTRNVRGEAEGNIVRYFVIRNIDNILRVPECIELIRGNDKEWILDELSFLSTENRHHFSALAPQWMLFHEKTGSQVVSTLATILPYLHVSEWHMFSKIIPCANEGDNFESVLTLCSAVNLIIRSAASKETLMSRLNLKSCVCNLGSVIQSHILRNVKPSQSPIILQELLALLEFFPKSEQFDVAVFLLPTMMELIDRAKEDGVVLSTLGGLLLKTSVQCVRRDLGRHLKRLALNYVNGNEIECNGQ